MSANSKNVLPLKQIFANADMSGNLTSQSIPILYLDNISISLLFPTNASATGAFFVDVSNDNINWFPLPFGSNMSLPDVDNAIQIDCTQVAASWTRVRYVFVSGTGTLNGFIQGKAV